MVNIGELDWTNQGSNTSYTLGQAGESYKIVYWWGGASNTYMGITYPNGRSIELSRDAHPMVSPDGNAASFGPIVVPGDTTISDENSNDPWYMAAIRIA